MLYRKNNMVNLEEAHIKENQLREELERIGKLPNIIYPNTWKAIEEYDKILNKEMQNE